MASATAGPPPATTGGAAAPPPTAVPAGPATASPPGTTSIAAAPEVIDPLDHPYRLTVDRYLRMVESGAIGEDDPVYLWKGRLVAKMSRNRPHSYSTGECYKLMIRIVPAGWFVDQEQPMAIPDDGVPEPDLTVVRGSAAEFKTKWVTAADVALIVEVADTTLSKDRGTALEAYAAARIPVYWIVNLRDRLIEVHADPAGDPGVAHYRSKQTYGPGQDVPVVLDGREVGRLPAVDVLP